MGIVDRIKETMKSSSDDHKHTPLDDAWEEVVSVIGPKLAEGIWGAIPVSLRELVSKPGAENIFQLLSFGFKRILPDSGVGAFVSTLQREVAGELRELAQKHRSVGIAANVSAPISTSGMNAGAVNGSEGANQILRLELQRAERIIAWLACLRVADLPELKPEDIVRFLDKLTLRELRTFADMSDEAKRAYAEARIGKTIPEVAGKSAENKILHWLGEKWNKLSDALCQMNSDLEEIALVKEEEIDALEKEYQRLSEEEIRPLKKIGWRFWRWFSKPKWQVWKL